MSVENLEMAVLDRNLPAIRALLLKSEAWDLNTGDPDAGGLTALHRAVENRAERPDPSQPEILKLLLAHPNIDVNSVDQDESPPLFRASGEGLRLLLQDSRVDVTLLAGLEWSCAWVMAREGKLESLEWLIASGRDFPWDTQGRDAHDGKEMTPGEIAENQGHPEVVRLLTKFRENPGKTRQEVRKKLGVTDFPVETPPKLSWAQYAMFVREVPAESTLRASRRHRGAGPEFLGLGEQRAFTVYCGPKTAQVGPFLLTTLGDLVARVRDEFQLKVNPVLEYLDIKTLRFVALEEGAFPLPANIMTLRTTI